MYYDKKQNKLLNGDLKQIKEARPNSRFSGFPTKEALESLEIYELKLTYPEYDSATQKVSPLDVSDVVATVVGEKTITVTRIGEASDTVLDENGEDVISLEGQPIEEEQTVDVYEYSIVYKVIDLTEEELAERASASIMFEEKRATINREQRDKLLTESDWVVTKSLELGEAVPEAWLTYRQELRDITESEGWPLQVTWPTKPSA